MDAMASQITGVSIVYSTVYSGADQRKHQKLRVTGLCEGNSLFSPLKWLVMRKIFPFDGVIMCTVGELVSDEWIMICKG